MEVKIMKNKDPPINIIPGPSGSVKAFGFKRCRQVSPVILFNQEIPWMKSKLAIFKTSFINKTSLKIKLRFFSLLKFLYWYPTKLVS